MSCGMPEADEADDEDKREEPLANSTGFPCSHHAERLSTDDSRGPALWIVNLANAGVRYWTREAAGSGASRAGRMWIGGMGAEPSVRWLSI